MNKLMKDPIPPCLIALGALASAWTIASPKEVLIVKLDGEGTIVYISVPPFYSNIVYSNSCTKPLSDIESMNTRRKEFNAKRF